MSYARYSREFCLVTRNHKPRGLRCCTISSSSNRGLNSEQALHFSFLEGLRSPCDIRNAHNHGIANFGNLEDTPVQNRLVCMYPKYGSTKDAHALLSCLHCPDQLTWLCMIRMHARNGQSQEAIQLYHSMLCHGQLPDSAIISTALLACSRGQDLVTGQHIHASICDTPFEIDVSVGNNLISLYCKNNSLYDAEVVFQKMPNRDAVSWTALSTTYAKHNNSEHSFTLFERMKLECVMFDRYAITSILTACCDSTPCLRGKTVHVYVLGNHLEEDLAVGNSLINMYIKCGSFLNAERVFHNMISKNEITWTTMIKAYTLEGDYASLIRFFHQMLESGYSPNKVTYINILSAWTYRNHLIKGIHLHSCIANESDMVVQTSIVTMYGKCGNVDEARNVFDRMSEHNVCSWNAMIMACNTANELKYSGQLFCQIIQEGVLPDKTTYIELMSNNINLAEGKALHSCIISLGFQTDIFIGNVLICMYGRCQRIELSWEIFNSMYEWNRVTFLNVLSCCVCPASLDKGKKFHSNILEEHKFGTDIGLTNALINMYSKCGSLHDAYKTFLSAVDRDCISWSIMIAAHSHYGNKDKTMQLLQDLGKQGLMLDKVALLTILTACSSLALISEGKWIHNQIVYSDLHTNVEVLNALINMYNKCNRKLEAEAVFHKSLKRDVVLWTSMISMYIQDGEVNYALALFIRMHEESVLPSEVTYVNLLSAYSTQVKTSQIVLQCHAVILWCGFESNAVVGTALISMYGKSGNIQGAINAFNGISVQNLLSYNTMMSVYAQHGLGLPTLQLFQYTLKQGFVPDEATMISVLSACSHTGLLKQAFYFILSMMVSYNTIPNVDHYNCIFDCLRRAGKICFLKISLFCAPIQPNFISWMTVLGGLQDLDDAIFLEDVVDHALEVDYEMSRH